MRASLIQVNLVIVTVDVDDNTWLVRFLHGIHLLVIIGPQINEGTSRPQITKRCDSLIS